MTERTTCRFESPDEPCERQAFCRGFCAPHYKRLLKSGKLPRVVHRGALSLPACDNFWLKVENDGDPLDCWVWTGRLDRDGYGRSKFLGRYTGAHRVAYEELIAKIPDGLVIDHLCRNRRCVNPWHLEPVTSRVNTQRGARMGGPGGPGRPRRADPRRGCRTHGRSNGYVYTRPSGYELWICRPCRKVRVDRWRGRG